MMDTPEKKKKKTHFSLYKVEFFRVFITRTCLRDGENLFCNISLIQSNDDFSYIFLVKEQPLFDNKRCVI